MAARYAFVKAQHALAICVATWLNQVQAGERTEVDAAMKIQEMASNLMGQMPAKNLEDLQP